MATTFLAAAAAPCSALLLLLAAVVHASRGGAGATACASFPPHHHRRRAIPSAFRHPPRLLRGRTPSVSVPTSFFGLTRRSRTSHVPRQLPGRGRRCPAGWATHLGRLRLSLSLSRRGGHQTAPTAAGADPPLWPSAMDGAEEEAEDYQRNHLDDEDDEDDISRVFDAIIKIHCTHSEPDHLMPWQRVHQTTSTSSGFVVDVGTGGTGRRRPRIMTNAHSVEYATMVRVQRRGDGRKFEAVVEVMGNECDLAILRVDSPQFWGEDGDEGVGGDEDEGDGDGEDEGGGHQRSSGRRPPPAGGGGRPKASTTPPLADLALTFGPLPALQDEVEVLGYPTGGDSMSVTSGVVSRIEMQEYVQAGMHLLAMQIDAAINPGNSGGPVVDGDLRVVGVAFQSLDSSEAQNVGYVVPVTVVRHFLEDVRRHGGRFTGFPSLGIALSLLENVAHRKSLGLTREDRSGVAVREIQPTAAAADILRPSDVIMEVDGIPVSNDGKIPFRPGERVALGCYTQTKFPGDTVTLSLLRSGEEMVVDVPVSPSPRLVPAHWNDRPPPYLIVSGLVFTALSVPFLEAAGAWGGYVSDNVSYLLGRVDDPLEREGDQVVVLAQVLAHRANLGYDGFSDLHLTRLNGERVRSLRHLERLLSHPRCGDDGDDVNPRTGETKVPKKGEDDNDEFLRFEFAPTKQIIVLERSSLEVVTREVCGEHCIQRPSVLLPHESREDDGDDDDFDDGEPTEEEPIECLREPVVHGSNKVEEGKGEGLSC